MKRIFFTSIFISLFVLVFSQKVSIQAHVFDRATKKTMPFVGVMLSVGDSLVKGGMSDGKGVFILEGVEIGVYTLTTSFVGYESDVKTLNISGKNKAINLGPIYLQEDAELLDDIEIIAQESQMKFEVDKKVFSVDQNISSAGGSVSEVLENVPSVEVDPEGNISLRSSTNVEVWINGKPSGLTEDNRAQILEQMPAGSIQSVEIITNPSAKYSPEGTAGIINLVLKKDRKAGYFGNATAGIILPSESNVGETAGLNFNFNKGKVDAYLNIGFRNWSHIHEGVTDRYYFSGADTVSAVFQDKYYTHIRQGVNGRFGFNYHMNDKHSIGIAGFGLLGIGINEELVSYDIRDSLNAIESKYSRDIYETGYRNSGNATLDHSWSIDKKGSQLLTSLSYSFFEIGRDANYLQTIQEGLGTALDQVQNLDASNNSWQFKSDLTKNFSENSKFETGVDLKKRLRYSYSDGANKIGETYVDVPTLFNSFSYGEQIYAYYASYGSKINELRLMGGLRGEYTLISTETKSSSDIDFLEKEDYQLYPSAFLAYNITKKDEIQLNYTRRIDRPRGRRLNSFHDYSDSTNISYGNPYLKPEFTSAYELNYLKTYGKNDQHMLSSSLYYRFTDNEIERIRFEDNGVLNTTYMNVTQSESSGLELISKNSIAKFLNLTTTLDFFYYYLQPSSFDISSTQTVLVEGNESFSWKARIISNFLLSKTFSAQITGRYSSPKAVVQGTSLARYRLDLGIRKSFFDKTVNASLSVRDVFNTRKRITETADIDFSQYEEFSFVGPQATFTITYNFGNGEKKKEKKQNDMNGEDVEDF